MFQEKERVCVPFLIFMPGKDQFKNYIHSKICPQMAVTVLHSSFTLPSSSSHLWTVFQIPPQPFS